MSITINRMNIDDEQEIQKVIELIYSTDDYIYPAMCDGDYKYFEKAAGKLLFIDSLFSHNNIDVARVEGHVAGILLTLDSSARVPELQEFKALGLEVRPCLVQTMANYFTHLVKEIAPDSLYINNISVSPDFKRRGVADALLGYALRKADGRRVMLDCLEKNGPAVALYSKKFKITRRFNGYTGNNTSVVLPCLTFEAVLPF